MKKKIFSLLFSCFAFGALPVSGQQSVLLEKYRTMALDYNHDLKAAEKNIAASVEVEKSARADLKPKLSGAANFQYTGNPLECAFLGIIEDCGRTAVKVWSFSFHSSAGIYGGACAGVYPYGATSTIFSR